MAVAAKINQNFDEIFESIVAQETWQTPILVIPEMEWDIEARAKAAHFLGSTVLGTEATADYIDEADEHRAYSLMDAIHEANTNEMARAMVQSNVATDYWERSTKSGHIMKVKLEIDEENRVVQYGQTAEDIQANTIKFASKNPKMKPRQSAEVRNKFRIDEALKRGLLEDNVLVIFSRAADDMSEQEMEDEGFFGDTMSCAIQIIATDEDSLFLESAFVAGKKRWDAPRHDAQTLDNISRDYCLGLEGKTAAEQLDTPVLIPKSMIPNGVIDVVKWWDGDDTFFGEDKPQQDYLEYRQQCLEREAAAQPIVERVTNQLISEAPFLSTPKAACQRLGKLVEQELITQSLTDTSINPRVLGVEAAYRIEQARYYLSQGRDDLVAALMHEAQQVARSYSCPGGPGERRVNEAKFTDTEQPENNSPQEVEDCDFISKECPKCHTKNVRTVVKKGRYYGDCGCHT